MTTPPFNETSGDFQKNVSFKSNKVATKIGKGVMTPRFSIISLYLLFVGFVLATVRNTAAGAEFGGMGELVRIVTLGPAYLLALSMIITRLNLCLMILGKCKLYLAFIVFCFLSSFWSLAPRKVLLNGVHDVGFFMIAILLVMMIKDRGFIFVFRHFSLASIILVCVSIIVSIYFPAIGIHDSTRRWQGVVGNPNTLGMFCVICVWSLLMVYNLTSSLKYRILSFLSLGIPFFALIGGGKIISMTSLVLTVSLCLTLPFIVILNKGNYNFFVTKLIFVFLFLFSGLLAIYAFTPGVFSIDYILLKLGRDRTLTGRTTLWEMGGLIFSMKPWLGWGFDSLMSVMKNFHFEVTQFHNGYLDLAIRGGLVSLLFFFSILFLTYRRLLKGIRRKGAVGWGLVAFVFVIMLHNLSEASIMRPTNLYWFTFLLVYMISCNSRLLLPIESLRRNNV